MSNSTILSTSVSSQLPTADSVSNRRGVLLLSVATNMHYHYGTTACTRWRMPCKHAATMSEHAAVHTPSLMCPTLSLPTVSQQPRAISMTAPWCSAHTERTCSHHERAQSRAPALSNAYSRLCKHCEGGGAQQGADDGSRAIGAHRQELARPPALCVDEARHLAGARMCVDFALLTYDLPCTPS